MVEGVKVMVERVKVMVEGVKVMVGMQMSCLKHNRLFVQPL